MCRPPQRWMLLILGFALALAAISSLFLLIDAQAVAPPTAAVSPLPAIRDRLAPAGAALATVRIRVNQDHGWVDGYLPPNATVLVTLTNSAGTVKGTNTTHTNDGGRFDGIDFYNGGDRVSIETGDTVKASAGGVVRSVTTLPITGLVDKDAESISGVIQGGVFPATVAGEVFVADGPRVLALTDAEGRYTVHFSPFDVKPDDQVFLTYYELDGDSTGVVRKAFTLRINYRDEWVESFYEGGHTVWITNTHPNGTTIKGSAEVQSGPIPWWGGQPGFQTRQEDWAPQVPDILPDDWVFASADNGDSAAAHIGTITGEVDVATDSVHGTVYAPWFSEPVAIECHSWGLQGNEILKYDSVLPDGIDEYTCAWDPATEWDILPGQDVGVAYTGPDGNWIVNAFRVEAPDLGVSKEGMSQPAPGGGFVYRIHYNNHGRAPATGVLITDTLPAGLTYGMDTSGVTPTIVGQKLVWDLGEVPAGFKTEFDLFVEVSPSLPVGAHLLNKVEIGCEEYDPELKDNSYEWDTQAVANDTHLNVGKWAWTGDPLPGGRFVNVINVCNFGSTGSSPVTVEDTLDPSTTLIDWSNQHPIWEDVSHAGGKLVVKAPSIPGGWCSAVYVHLLLDDGVEPGASISDTAVIAADNDLETDDNTGTWYGNAGKPHTNLEITEDWFWGELVPGGTIYSEMRFANSGNVPVQNVVITDTVPSGVMKVHIRRFDQDWHDLGEVTPLVETQEHVVWEVGDLANGEQGFYRLTALIADGAVPGTEMTHAAEISPQPMEDSFYDNRTSRTETLHGLGPNLRVDKHNYSWEGTARLRYEIRVMNLGSEAIQDISITDTYPESTIFSDWKPNHGPWSGYDHNAATRELTLHLDGLKPGETASSGVYVNLGSAVQDKPGLVFTNVVDAPIPDDVDPSDNHDEAVSMSGPDLWIKKWLTDGVPKPGELLTFTLHFEAAPYAWNTAGDVWVTDTLPSGLEFVSARQRLCWGEYWCERDPEVKQDGEVAWNFGQWGQGWWNELKLTVRVADSVKAGDVLENVATIGSSDPVDEEADVDNNRDTVLVSIGGKVYLPLAFRNLGP